MTIPELTVFDTDCGTSAAPEWNYDMAQTLNFTKQSLGGLPLPQRGRSYCQDSKEKGLALYITSNGVITFFVRKRVNGRDERIVLGRFPDLSIENARKQALKVKSDVALGIDPSQEKAAP